MKRFGLPDSCCLRKTAEFNRVYRRGIRLYGNGFLLVYLHGDQLASRLGVSVPRRVGTAVRRNRIKRLVREVFRLHREIFPRSSDIVFAVRPGFSFPNIHTVRDAVAGLTGKTGKLEQG
ncbi:MAG: ribonuclease P protein component [Candidatus Electrothrix sp. YB6]